MVQPLDATTRRYTSELDTRDFPDAGSPPPTPSPTRPPSQAELDAAHAARPAPPPDYAGADLAGLMAKTVLPNTERRGNLLEKTAAAPKTRTAVEIQARVDRLSDEALGRFRVGDTAIRASMQFRLVGSADGTLDDGKPTTRPAELDAVARKAGIPAITILNLRMGRGTPDEAQRVGQALIDAGKLTSQMLPATPDGVRGLMWKYGIGVDCAGYVQQAFVASRGMSREDLGLKPDIKNEDLSGLANRPEFQREPNVAHARPGDLIILKPPPPPPGMPPSPWGHTVIVYSNLPITAAEAAAVPGMTPDTAAALVGDGKGKLRLIEVDSSWGTGATSEPYGGVHRREWLLNESTNVWAYHDDQKFVTSAMPYGHPVDGVYRPRGEL